MKIKGIRNNFYFKGHVFRYIQAHPLSIFAPIIYYKYAFMCNECKSYMEITSRSNDTVFGWYSWWNTKGQEMGHMKKPSRSCHDSGMLSCKNSTKGYIKSMNEAKFRELLL